VSRTIFLLRSRRPGRSDVGRCLECPLPLDRRWVNCDRATEGDRNVVGFRIGVDRDAMVQRGGSIGCKQVSQGSLLLVRHAQPGAGEADVQLFSQLLRLLQARVIDEDDGFPRFDRQIGPTREWRILGRVFTICFDVGRTDFGADVGVVRFVPLTLFEQ
jgi:hypothetical protein